jgi:hypothetical protein
MSRAAISKKSAAASISKLAGALHAYYSEMNASGEEDDTATDASSQKKQSSDPKDASAGCGCKKTRTLSRSSFLTPPAIDR